MSVGIPKKKGIFSRNFNTIFTPKTVNSTPLIVFNIPMSFLKLASVLRRMRWLNAIIDSVDRSLSKLWEMLKHRKAWSAAIHGVTKSWTHLSNWTTATFINGLPLWVSSEESACNVGDAGSIPGWGGSPGGGHGSPLHYSCLENPMNIGACWGTVHRVAKNWTQLRWWLSTKAHIY